MEHGVGCERGARGLRRMVFLGPTKLGIDESWTNSDKSNLRGKDLLRWKVKKFLTSKQRTDGRTDAIDDPLIEVRKKKDDRTLTLTKRNLATMAGLVDTSPRPLDSGRDGGEEEDLTVHRQASMTDVADVHVPSVTLGSDQSDAGSSLAARGDPVGCSMKADVEPHPPTRTILGPARQVGLSRKERLHSRHLPPFLKSTKRRRNDVAHNEKSTDVFITSTEEARAGTEGHNTISTDAQLSLTTGLETTNDSIVPHRKVPEFDPKCLTEIKEILDSPEKLLSPLQGGQNQNSSNLHNMLVLVHHVGPIVPSRTWQGKTSLTNTRCDIVVQDDHGRALKVVLEGSCATAWCGEKLDDDGNGDEENHFAQTDKTNLSVSHSTSSFESTSRRCETQSRAMPIKAGDVIHLSNVRLRLSRFRHAPTVRASSTRSVSLLASNVYAAASMEDFQRSTIELWWRNEIADTLDEEINFDPALAQIDHRSRLIYTLAVAWHRT